MRVFIYVRDYFLTKLILVALFAIIAGFLFGTWLAC